MADALNEAAAKELLLTVLLRERLRWGSLDFFVTQEDSEARGFEVDVVGVTSDDGKTLHLRARPRQLKLSGRLG